MGEIRQADLAVNRLGQRPSAGTVLRELDLLGGHPGQTWPPTKPRELRRRPSRRTSSACQTRPAMLVVVRCCGPVRGRRARWMEGKSDRRPISLPRGGQDHGTTRRVTPSPSSEKMARPLLGPPRGSPGGRAGEGRAHLCGKSPRSGFLHARVRRATGESLAVPRSRNAAMLGEAPSRSARASTARRAGSLRGGRAPRRRSHPSGRGPRRRASGRGGRPWVAAGRPTSREVISILEPARRTGTPCRRGSGLEGRRSILAEGGDADHGEAIIGRSS